jgi:hypothetical protein
VGQLHFEINLSQFPHAGSVKADSVKDDAGRGGSRGQTSREGELPRPQPQRKLIATKFVWLRSNNGGAEAVCPMS